MSLEADIRQAIVTFAESARQFDRHEEAVLQRMEKGAADIVDAFRQESPETRELLLVDCLKAEAMFRLYRGANRGPTTTLKTWRILQKKLVSVQAEVQRLIDDAETVAAVDGGTFAALHWIKGQIEHNDRITKVAVPRVRGVRGALSRAVGLLAESVHKGSGKPNHAAVATLAQVVLNVRDIDIETVRRSIKPADTAKRIATYWQRNTPRAKK
jgi:hypothetical protein